MHQQGTALEIEWPALDLLPLSDADATGESVLCHATSRALSIGSVMFLAMAGTGPQAWSPWSWALDGECPRGHSQKRRGQTVVASFCLAGLLII